jgi:hypothetical protein
MAHSGILSITGKGKFRLGEGKPFVPEVSTTVKRLYNDLIRQFPFVQICVWSTSIINEFMLHQPGRNYLLVEVERETTQSVFNYLSEKKKKIFLDPTAEVINLYASKEDNPIIIKPLVSEAPVQLVENVINITLEKMLVDIFCDQLLFAAQQGREMQTIFGNAFENYIINENKLLRYVGRRRRKESFLAFLHKNSKFLQQT